MTPPFQCPFTLSIHETPVGVSPGSGGGVAAGVRDPAGCVGASFLDAAMAANVVPAAISAVKTAAPPTAPFSWGLDSGRGALAVGVGDGMGTGSTGAAVDPRAEGFG